MKMVINGYRISCNCIFVIRLEVKDVKQALLLTVQAYFKAFSQVVMPAGACGAMSAGADAGMAV